MKRRPRFLIAALAAGLVLLSAAPSMAEVATALLREDDTLPGAPGENVDSINNPVVNHAGGFGLTVNTSGSGTTLSHIWGNATGGAGDVIVTEGTYGDYIQTSFESFHGLSNDGTPGYSALANSISTGSTSLDGAWRGTQSILVEEEPVASLPGQFSVFNSRVAITADGEPYWVGGISTTQGGSTQNRVLFFGVGQTPVLMGGDSVGGVPEAINTGSSNIDFDYRFSALGTNYITPVDLVGPSATDKLLVINGNAALAAGGLMREGTPISPSAGGLPGENWSNFDFLSITENGSFFVTGDTSGATATDEFVLIDGVIVLREGDTLTTDEGSFTLSGSIEGGYMNEQGDWAVIWDVNEPGGANVEALIINGELTLREGQAVDLDGNGEVEPNSLIANFTGITTLVVGDRGPSGGFAVYFTADIDVNGTSTTIDDIEGLFRLGGEAPMMVPLDIKPGNCPAVHNPFSNGVLKFGLLGTDMFDVTQIDLSTVEVRRSDGVGGSVGLLGSPTPIYVDAAEPPSMLESCGCSDPSGDGVTDIQFFLDSGALGDVLALESVPGSEVIELVVTGSLLDDTSFEGRDCITIVPPGNSNRPRPPQETTAGTVDPAIGAVSVGSRSVRPGSGPEEDPLTVVTTEQNRRERLRVLRGMLGRTDSSMKALVRDHLRQIRDQAQADGDEVAAREAERLLRYQGE